MKKMISLLLCLLLLASLAGCGGKDTSLLDSLNDPGETSSPGLSSPNESTAIPASQTGSGGDSIASLGAQSYAGAYTRFEAVNNALLNKLEGIIEPYNEKREAEDENYHSLSDDYRGGWLLPFMSIDFAFTATLDESTARDSSSLAMALGFFGATNVAVNRNGANDYTVTFDTEEGESETYLCKWDPASDSLRYVSLGGASDGSDFFMEYTALGNGAYALQSPTERAIVTFTGDDVTSLIYTINRSDMETGGLPAVSPRYDADADSIFGKTGLTSDWATAKRDDLATIYQYDGAALSVERCVMEYEGEWGAYTGRNWIWKDAVTITP